MHFRNEKVSCKYGGYFEENFPLTQFSFNINVFGSVEKNLADANMEFISKNVRQQGKECLLKYVEI